MAYIHNNSLPEPSFVYSKKNSKLALYRFPHRSSIYPPVIMTHGTFSNAFICQELAKFLNKEGFDCWIYEWSGHGQSEFGDLTPDAEDYALCDVPSVLKAVQLEAKQKTCIWIAHSGGGFLPLMYMARDSVRQKEIQALVTLGSQTTGAGRTFFRKGGIIVAMIIMRLFGRIPGPLFGLGPEDERMRFLQQWCKWNWMGKWLGKDKFDYLEALKKISIPTLCIAGGGDKLAPPEGCYDLFRALNSRNKKFILCSKKNGFAEDYNHPRLIASHNAQNEIWPSILNFVRSNRNIGTSFEI
jgi:oxygen-independent coproporphyrinogen-3 oxidase